MTNILKKEIGNGWWFSYFEKDGKILMQEYWNSFYWPEERAKGDLLKRYSKEYPVATTKA